MNIRQEYYRLRRNLLARNYRLRKKGKKEISLPKIPKKITEKSISKLLRLSSAPKKVSTKKKSTPSPRSATYSYGNNQILAEAFISLMARVRSCVDKGKANILDAWDNISNQYKNQIANALVLEQDPKQLEANVKEYEKIYRDVSQEVETVLMQYHEDVGNETILHKVIAPFQKYLQGTVIVKMNQDMLVDLATGEIIE